MIPALIEATIRLLAVLAAAGFSLAAFAAYLMARALVRPPRMSDGKALHVLKRLTPRDLGMPFTAVQFDIRDERTNDPLCIAGWWIPAEQPSDTTVVLVHGYADAKVGAIAWADVWRQQGCHLLAIDLRAHGDSGGTICTGGYWERHDLAKVLGEWTARQPAESRRIILFGASLGAAVVAGAAAQMSESRSNAGQLAGMVLESPFADFRTACSAHLERVGMPGGIVRRWAMKLAGWMAHADFATVRPVDLINQIPCPVLLMLPGNDLYLQDDERAAMEQAIDKRPAGDGALVRFADTDHLMGIVNDRPLYLAAVQGFMQKITASPGPGTTFSTANPSAPHPG